jgi:hypothetical protein
MHPQARRTLRELVAFVLAASLASFACSTESAAPSSKKTSSSAATFACADSLQRVDGTQRAGTPCNIAREYCYEASGGTPFSHGAHCRPLPKSGATCADIVALIGAGSAGTGTPITGLRVQFAYP